MADNKVLIEFQIVQKGGKISAIAKETDQLTKAQDKAAGSQKKLTKQQDMGYGRQKQGLVQTANSTKNFSKLANTIDGDGGGGTSLVGAYATLAANVFAASAAFNALSRAAEFQQLQQGLEIVGNQSGRTLSVLADNLRDATDGALSLEQASRGAALGVSGGFGAKELTGLAEIAKGASIALGRDLGDAFDRLTRGAIKLEPEILDELGIMVRLDDAVEKYAAQLGKSAGALSQLERRQAFMNEILEQGATKFGDIKLEFFDEIAPKHVESFKLHAQNGYYDGTIFHRVIPGFMIQGGDPLSKSEDKSRHGTGGNAAKYFGIGDENSESTWDLPAEFSATPHERGILSMARSQNPDSGGSQFFICVADARFLDNQYTVFGKVVSGMDVVDSIVNAPRDARDNPDDRIEMKVKLEDK